MIGEGKAVPVRVEQQSELPIPSSDELEVLSQASELKYPVAIVQTISDP